MRKRIARTYGVPSPQGTAPFVLGGLAALACATALVRAASRSTKANADATTVRVPVSTSSAT